VQISVAVLLDKFITARTDQEEEGQRKRLEELASRSTIHNTLDPLLDKISRDYIDDSDLSTRLRKLYEVPAFMTHSNL
jgi:hypothetical protein